MSETEQRSPRLCVHPGLGELNHICGATDNSRRDFLRRYIFNSVFNTLPLLIAFVRTMWCPNRARRRACFMKDSYGLIHGAVFQLKKAEESIVEMISRFFLCDNFEVKCAFWIFQLAETLPWPVIP